MKSVKKMWLLNVYAFTKSFKIHEAKSDRTASRNTQFSKSLNNWKNKWTESKKGSRVLKADVSQLNLTRSGLGRTCALTRV